MLALLCGWVSNNVCPGFAQIVELLFSGAAAPGGYSNNSSGNTKAQHKCSLIYSWHMNLKAAALDMQVNKS